MIGFKTIGIGLIIFILSFGWSRGGYAQTSDNNEAINPRLLYETAKMQFEFLQETQSLDSLLIGLFEEAEKQAGQGQFEDAYLLISSALDLISFNQSTIEDSLKTSGNSNKKTASQISNSSYLNYLPEKDIQLEAGIDYSRQEFEMSFLNTDSLIKEQLQNPYLAFYYFQPFSWGKSELLMSNRFRIDNQFLNYGFAISSEKRYSSTMTKWEITSNLFYSQESISPHFLDNQFSFLFGQYYGYPHRWYFQFRSRYKWLPKPDASNNDIVSASLLNFYEYNWNFNSRIFTAITPEYYQEKRANGQQFFQVTSKFVYYYRSQFNRLFEIGIEPTVRFFKNFFDNSEYRNQYWELKPYLRMETAFGKLGIRAQGYLQNRVHRNSDEITPDMRHLEVELIPKFYFKEFTSVGIGYRYESEVHFSDKPDISEFIRQEDYRATGVVFTAEIYNQSGLLLNLEYSLSRKNYLHPEDRTFFSYYSDRIIYDLQLIGWIPLASGWQIQAFINYNSDQDQELVNNDNRNTIISLGLIYDF